MGFLRFLVQLHGVVGRVLLNKINNVNLFTIFFVNLIIIDSLKLKQLNLFLFRQQQKYCLNTNICLSMHSKLSMKNLQTFGRENPFCKQRSLSSRSKSQFQSFGNPNFSSASTFELRQAQTIRHKHHNQYQISKVQTPYNMDKQSHHRPTSTSNQPSKQPKKCPSPIFPTLNPPTLQTKSSVYCCNQILYLLSNQPECLDRIKQTIEQDKQKINAHFTDFKQTVNNIIDDLKLSICATVDQQYLYFVNQFRVVKVEYANYCNLKKEFWHIREGVVERAEKYADIGKNGTPKYPGMVVGQGRNEIDNQKLLLNMIEDIKDCKKHLNYVQFGQIQQKTLKPVLKTVKSLIKQLQIQSYYHPEIAHNTFKQLQQSIEDDVHQMYQRIDSFISMQMRDDTEEKCQGGHLGKVNKRQPHMEISHVQKYPESTHKPQQKPTQKQTSPFHIHLHQPHPHPHPPPQPQSQQTSQILQLRNEPLLDIINHPQANKKQKYSSTANTELTSTHKSKRFSHQYEDQVIGNQDKVGFTGGKGKGSWKQGKQGGIKLEEYRVITDKGSKPAVSQSQTALCVVYLNFNKIAVGTKNGLLKIFCTKTGTKLSQLSGHRASICSLSLIQESNLLMSGGDIGCCQLILWQPQHNKIYHNYGQVHGAAITCCVELGDGKHVMSGSFDSCVNIYNYKKKELVKSVNTGQKISTLGRMADRNGGEVVVGGNLNSQVMVWRVDRNSFNSITGLELVRAINIGTYPYSVVQIDADDVLVSGKDNWLRMVNLSRGSIQTAKQLGQYYQLLPIQNLQTVIGFNKNKSISTISQQMCEQIIGNNSCLGYSCGIHPKCAISPSSPSASAQSYVYVANHQNSQETEIKVWKISSKPQKCSEYYNQNGSRTYS